MSKIILTVSILALSATTALAGGRNDNRGGGNESPSYSNASQHQGQRQSQRQSQNQAQGQAQGQVASNGGNAVNNNQVYHEAPQAPAVMAGSSCGVGGSLGVGGTLSGVYVPISAGLTFESRTCVILREAVFMASIGRKDLAITHLTHIKRVKKSVEAHSE